jgi:hypothetical protein
MRDLSAPRIDAHVNSRGSLASSVWLWDGRTEETKALRERYGVMGLRTPSPHEVSLRKPIEN